MNDLMTKSFTNYVDLKKEAMRDLEAGHQYNLELPTNTTDQNLNLFLKEAENFNKQMSIIREILIQLQQSNEETKTMHKPETLKQLQLKINNISTKKAKEIKSQLQQMDRANAANIKGTPIYRTRIVVTNGLHTKLNELMMDFQKLRQKTITEYKDTISRRYFTVTGEKPAEDVTEKIISDGGEGFLTRAIQEHGRGNVLETVVEIQDRTDAVEEIEKSLLELHQVFLDMAIMVEVQGERMDDIEQHVLDGKYCVKDSTKEIKKAKDYSNGSRKWLCFGIVLLLLIILLIVFPIVF